MYLLKYILLCFQKLKEALIFSETKQVSVNVIGFSTELYRVSKTNRCNGEKHLVLSPSVPMFCFVFVFVFIFIHLFIYA